MVVSDVGAPQLVVCISGGREEEYRELLSDFVEWSGRNHVFLNAAKTKEIGLPMVIDFRKRRMATEPLKIQPQDIEVVEDYKSLGVHINSKLNWKTYANAVHKKEMSGLFLLRKLRSFLVCAAKCWIFSTSVLMPVHCSLLGRKHRSRQNPPDMLGL